MRSKAEAEHAALKAANKELANKTKSPVAAGEGPERMRPDLASGCQVRFGGGSGNICFQIRHSVDFGRCVPHLGNGQALVGWEELRDFAFGVGRLGAAPRPGPVTGNAPGT